MSGLVWELWHLLCIKRQVGTGCYLYKTLSHLSLWQNIDSKVAIWNLGPNHEDKDFFCWIIANYCSNFLVYSGSPLSWKSSFFSCQIMDFPISIVLLSSWAAVAFMFPHSTFDNIVKGSKAEFESSGSGPDEPIQGLVKVLQLDPHNLVHSGFFRRGLMPRRTPSLTSRASFPAFLSHGRPGPAPAHKTLVSPLHHLHPKSPSEMDLKRRQSLQMWQRAINKGEKLTASLPVNLKDTKQTCAAVPFTQVRFSCHKLFQGFISFLC